MACTTTGTVVLKVVSLKTKSRCSGSAENARSENDATESTTLKMQRNRNRIYFGIFYCIYHSWSIQKFSIVRIGDIAVILQSTVTVMRICIEHAAITLTTKFLVLFSTPSGVGKSGPDPSELQCQSHACET